MDYSELAARAVHAKLKAYAPYSKFHVGAALLTNEGIVYDGANIENVSFSLTICAERTAAFQAKLNGKNNFTAIAIASDLKDYVSPCGACRQVLMEICGPDLDVIMLNDKNEMKVKKLKDLLPESFNEF